MNSITKRLDIGFQSFKQLVKIMKRWERMLCQLVKINIIQGQKRRRQLQHIQQLKIDLWICAKNRTSSQFVNTKVSLKSIMDMRSERLPEQEAGSSQLKGKRQMINGFFVFVERNISNLRFNILAMDVNGRLRICNSQQKLYKMENFTQMHRIRNSLQM